VLDHGFWSRRFAADPGIVGDKIVLNNEAYTVVGVAPERFRFVERADVYVVGPRGVPEPPIDLGDDYENDRSTGYMTGFGRLRPEASFEVAVADMERIGRELARDYPQDRANRTFITIPLRERMVGSVASGLLMLLGAVGFVLLIACANVANLLLARASVRRREIAVRAALGASRGRIVRQLMTESVALSTAGGVAGVILAVLCLGVLRVVMPGTLPRADEIGIDATVLAFTAGLSLLTGLLFGALPALQTAATDMQTVLRDDTRGASGGRSRARMRDALVVLELALTVALLIGAGTTLQGFLRLQSQSPGFEPDGVMTVRLALPVAKYDSDDEIVAFYRELVEEVRALPGVRSAAIVLGLPFSGTQAGLGYRLWGQPDDDPGFGANFQAVSAGYFGTMGIPLLAGRDFTSTDSARTSPSVIINEVLAERHFAGVNPVGQALKLDSGPDAEPVPIIGVVGPTRHFGYDRDPGPEVYLSFETLTFPFTSLVVRSAVDPEGLIALLRRTVTKLDPDQPVYRAQMLEDLMSDTIAQRRFNLQLITVFAALALLISAVGVFGVISYTVNQRTRELGIRVALGAAHGQVMGMVLRQAAALVVAGITLGLGGAFAAMRLAGNLWFGASTADPLVFLAVPTILGATALIATLLPALRATRVDPVSALRAE
jgi:predicted permease